MSIKLTYFDMRGRIEPTRLVLHAAKKPFQDVRIGFGDWEKFKQTTPFGSLPVATINGADYAQGMALASYFAKENGLYGSNNLEGLQIDQIAQLREDLLTEESKSVHVSDAKKKEELTKTLNDATYPRYLGYFTKLVEANKAKNKSDFAVGKKLSLADFVIYEGSQLVFQNNPDLLKKYPTLTALRARVEQVDGVKQYLAKRKISTF